MTHICREILKKEMCPAHFLFFHVIFAKIDT